MRKLAALTALFALLAAPGYAQTATASHADESYRLNIDQKVIKKPQYEASLAIVLGPPLPVRVGASISTGSITLVLRMVRGDVRFHGDLRRIEQLIQSHRSLASPPAGR